MKGENHYDEKHLGLDALIENITAGKTDDREIFRSFYRIMTEWVELPADGYVIEFIFEDDQRVGVRTRCRRENDETHHVSDHDLQFTFGYDVDRLVSACRRWLGLAPAESESSTAIRRRYKVEEGDIVNGEVVELAVLSLKENSVRCLDAHSHLGNLRFDNRPFLRCMQGYGLCAWRLRESRDIDLPLDDLLL